MPGPDPLPAERRIRRNVDAVTVVLAPYDGPRPDPPVPLHPDVQLEWERFWDSELADNLAVTDLGALLRLFRLKQLEVDASADCADEPMAEGSKGQLVMNPRCRQAAELAGQILQLEDRFGFHPKGRLANGIRMGAALDAAERHPAAFGLADQEREPRADPRLAVPVATAPDPRPGGGGLAGVEPRAR